MRAGLVVLVVVGAVVSGCGAVPTPSSVDEMLQSLGPPVDEHAASAAERERLEVIASLPPALPAVADEIRSAAELHVWMYQSPSVLYVSDGEHIAMWVETGVSSR